MAQLETLDPLDRAARSYAARILSESRLHDVKLSNEGQLVSTDDWDVIFSAEAELIRGLPEEHLKRRAPLVYERYADVVGPERAARLAANALPADCDPKLLLADLLQVHNETARHYMTLFQVERERTSLSRLVLVIGGFALLAFVDFISWPFLASEVGTPAALFIDLIVVGFIVAGILTYRWWVRRRQMVATIAIAFFAADLHAQAAGTQTLPDLPIVPLVMFAGILGACFSILQRVQRSTAADPLAALFNLRAARSQIYLSIVSGAIAALVIFAVFAGGMLEGGLFPTIKNAASTANSTAMMKLVNFLKGTGPASHADYGKLLVWAFIAGFAERFVPDILDRFTSSAKKS